MARSCEWSDSRGGGGTVLGRVVFVQDQQSLCLYRARVETERICNVL